MKVNPGLLISLISLLLISSSSQLNDYDRLLSWAKNNSCEISDKIGMKYISENNKTFFVKKDIKKNEVLFRIPSKILLTLDKALELSGKKINKLYEAYKKHKWGFSNDALKYRIQQSFLAYLMYNAMKHKSSKNKFYNFYQHYFNTFETSLDNYPVFYTAEQFNLIRVTNAANDIFQMHQIYEEEFSILEKEIIKKKMNYDDYIKYRTYTISKGNNITSVSTYVPFMDMFVVDTLKFNVNYTFEKTGVKIYALKKIKTTDNLLLRGMNISNSMSLLFYGKTYDSLSNIVDTFSVPIVSAVFIEEMKLDQKLANGERINLVHEKFYEEAMPAYMKFSKEIKEDGSPLSALRLFKGNLVALRKNYDRVTTSDIHKYFFTMQDINSIKRIMSTEKRFYDDKIRILDVLINYTIHNNTDANKDDEDKNLEL